MKPATILLAVDVAPGSPARHCEAAVRLITDMVADGAHRVVVLHVREFSLPRLARTMADHGGTSGRAVVDEAVSTLRAAGVHATGLIREADLGHIADTILAVAAEFDARLVVLGSRGSTDLPALAAGSVAFHLLRHARLPVLIAPAGTNGPGADWRTPLLRAQLAREASDGEG